MIVKIKTSPVDRPLTAKEAKAHVNPRHVDAAKARARRAYAERTWIQLAAMLDQGVTPELVRRAVEVYRVEIEDSAAGDARLDVMVAVRRAAPAMAFVRDALGITHIGGTR